MNTDFTTEARTEKYISMRKWFEQLAEVRQPFVKHYREQMVINLANEPEKQNIQLPQNPKFVLDDMPETTLDITVKIPVKKTYIVTGEIRERIPQFEKIKEQAKNWHPKFVDVSDINELAHMINKYHEDYPLRVDKTIELIENYIVLDKLQLITETDILQMHSHFFAGEGFNENHILRGAYRRVNVRVGNHRPPDFLFVDHLMKEIMPVVWHDDNITRYTRFSATTEIKMVEWYSLFQTIHPFQDGNGRVGAVVVAIISYIKTGKVLAPMQ